MESLAFFLSPPILVGLLVWNFAVLSAVQLTVRLIGAYSARATIVAALALTLACLPIAVAFVSLTDLALDAGVAAATRSRGLAVFQAYVFQQRLLWFPLTNLATAVAGFVVIRATLRFKRTRSAVVAAIGIGLLSAPWIVFLSLPG